MSVKNFPAPSFICFYHCLILATHSSRTEQDGDSMEDLSLTRIFQGFLAAVK